jgi:hypothetical protein
LSAKPNSVSTEHPNIITIYGIDQAADVDFITADTSRARHWSAHSTAGRLATALRCAVQVADALAAAHAAGIVS